VLHDVEGLDHREVAQALGISEGTSKSQVHKARHRLRRLLNARVPKLHAAHPQLVRAL
jgi:RNA polymerase sigma-70 factor (ECF subfamily)